MRHAQSLQFFLCRYVCVCVLFHIHMWHGAFMFMCRNMWTSGHLFADNKAQIGMSFLSVPSMSPLCLVMRILTKHGAWWLCYTDWVVNPKDPPISASEALGLSALAGSFYIKLELYIHSKPFWTKPSSQYYSLLILYLFLNIV